jgi:hypothetical protein
MKGPFERLKYDLRRVWECPQCGAKQRTDGSVTTRFCTCGKPNTNPPVSMKLVGDGPRRMVPPVPPPVIEPEPIPTAVIQVDVIATAAIVSEAVTEVDVLPPPLDPQEPAP